jgi:hypothetical protein
VVDQTTAGVVLPPANDELAAVLVPTARASEYFVLEYRVTPETGYGSLSPAYDGLVVYHVLEGSHQGQDPPLLKVEPADGVLGPGTTAAPTDLLFPGNGSMAQPFVVTSYFGGEDVFQIENVAFVAGGIEFDVTLLSASTTLPNLLANGSFEDGVAAEPDGWTPSAWQDTAGTFTWEQGVAHTGSRSAAITNTTDNDARWEQELGGLVVGQAYTVCAWLRGEGIAGEGAGTGANVSVVWTDTEGSQATSHSGGGFGTFDWTLECATFEAETETATIQCRLGHWASTVSGSMWCDDVTVEALESAF